MSKVFVIAQGGGPTAVINATLAGAVLEARHHFPGSKVLGARHGVRGMATGDYVDLSAVSDVDLLKMADTPSSALGSTRDKPDAAYCERIIASLRKVGATAFIYIGGNDTAGTLQILEQAAGGGIAFIHAPKTIDNDLTENDHTPGFISAGMFVAQAFHSVDLDFRALPGIYVGIVMGRHAGFLTASAAAWRHNEAEGPHLIYLPESPFSVERLLEDIRQARARHGRAVIAMSEGVTTESGRPLAEGLIPAERVERDAHGNLQLSGSDLGLALQATIAKEFPKVRARVDTFGYLPRGFVGAISRMDRDEAFEVGRFAAAVSEEGSGSVALQIEDGETILRLVPLAAVAGKTRLMPADFIAAAGNDITGTGMDYLRRLLPEKPDLFKPFV